VILVTWNVRDLVLTCIQRVFELKGELKVEVLLVDNGSSDGTLEAVAEGFPLVRIVKNRDNLGFPRANNLALLEARGRHILFLNPDTEVGTGTLEACVRELDEDPAVGAVGCRLLLPDGRVQFEGARRHYRLLDLVWEAFYLHMFFPGSRVFAHQMMGDWDHEGDRNVEALVGAFIMVRGEVVRDLGGMPDEVFMYHEDLALCLRLEKQGWKIRYLGGVTTLHHHQASTERSSSPLELLEGEARVRLIRERSGPMAGLVARLLFAVRASVRLSIALVASPLTTLRDRFPQVTNVRKHAGLAVWTVWPGFVRRRLRASGIPEDLRPGLLVVAPTPPPADGVPLFTKMLLSSLDLRTRFRVCHVEVAMDGTRRRSVRKLAEVLVVTWTRRPELCYMSLSQNALDSRRDRMLIAAARTSGARVVTFTREHSIARVMRELEDALA
jgi:GT2 family glycosyltransferase